MEEQVASNEPQTSQDAFEGMILAEDNPVVEEQEEVVESEEDSLTETEEVSEEGDELDLETEEVEEEDVDEEIETEEAELSTVTIGGKEYEVTPEVAEAHSLMEKDYTQKTMELSEQRTSFEGEVQNFQQGTREVNSIAAFIFEDLNRPIATLEQKQALMEAGDTDGLVEIQVKEAAQSERVEQFKQRAMQMNQVLQNQEAERLMQARKSCAETLQKEAPELLTEESRKANTDFLKNNGISNERMQQIVEPEVFKIIDMARRFTELEAKTEKLKKEVKKAPKASKNKGRILKNSAKQGRINDARKAVKETGSGQSYFYEIENR